APGTAPGDPGPGGRGPGGAAVVRGTRLGRGLRPPVGYRRHPRTWRPALAQPRGRRTSFLARGRPGGPVAVGPRAEAFDRRPPGGYTARRRGLFRLVLQLPQRQRGR